MEESYDIVIYGATSFVGEIIVSHMVDYHAEHREISWAIAGRSESKLMALKQKAGGPEVPHLIANADNEAQLTAMCSKAKVILSTVGPYALYGEPLLKVCAETGTDYCDLTGEVQWYRRMLRRYEPAAKASGARIVLCSGFDSVPSDLGVYFLQQSAHDSFGHYCNKVKNRVEKFSGGASGGSAISFLNVAKEISQSDLERQEMQNPYSLCPQDHNFHVVQNEVDEAQYDDDFGSWMGTFIMSKVNTRVVHRSNALSGSAYGEDFQYDEARLTGPGPKGKSMARRISWGFSAFMSLGGLAPIRWLLKKILPKPGEGPTPEQQLRGSYILRLVGRTRNNETIRVRVSGDRDPGYGSTAKIIAESAICLAKLPLDAAGGFWTPSMLYGRELLVRLENNAGLSFEVTSTQQ